MLNLLLDGSGTGSSWWIYVVLLVAVVFLLVFPMFTQKKRNKEFGEMVNGLSVGDEIRTIGGIIGKITKINKEGDMTKSIIIETGAANSKHTLELDVTCIAYILNQVNPPKTAENTSKKTKKGEDENVITTEATAEEKEDNQDNAINSDVTTKSETKSKSSTKKTNKK